MMKIEKERQRKSYVKALGFMMLSMLFSFIIVPKTANAESIKQIKEGKTYYLDLTGDGKKNCFYYESSRDFESYWICLDDNVFYYDGSDRYEWAWDCYVITHSPKVKYICMVGNDGDDNFYPRLYRYIGTKWKHIQDFKISYKKKVDSQTFTRENWADRVSVSGKKVKVTFKENFGMIGGVRFSTYYKYSKGKYSKSGKDYGVASTYQNLGKAKKSITLTKTAGSSRKSAVLKKGNKTKVTKIRIISKKVYAKLSSGKKSGWVRIDNKGYAGSYFTKVKYVGQ